MNAIVNTELLTIDRPPVSTVGFTPVVTFSLNAGTGVITMDIDATTYPAGDSFARVNYKFHDENGDTVVGTKAATTDLTVDLSALDLTRDIAVTATIVTTLGCITDGTARGINSGHLTGTLGSWTVGQFTTAVG